MSVILIIAGLFLFYIYINNTRDLMLFNGMLHYLFSILCVLHLFHLDESCLSCLMNAASACAWSMPLPSSLNTIRLCLHLTNVTSNTQQISSLPHWCHLPSPTNAICICLCPINNVFASTRSMLLPPNQRHIPWPTNGIIYTYTQLINSTSHAP